MWAMLVPICLIPRKNLKRIILKTLRKRYFLLKRLTREEFYGSKEEFFSSSGDTFFFRLNYKVKVDEIRKLIEDDLGKKKYKVYYSYTSNKSLCVLKCTKKETDFVIKVTSGIQIQNSFRISVETT
jgi:hypothetical protein